MDWNGREPHDPEHQAPVVRAQSRLQFVGPRTPVSVECHDRVMDVRLSPDVDVALRAQLELRRGVLVQGAEAVGWNVAASIPGVGDRGLDGLVFGYLTSATVVIPGALGPRLTCALRLSWVC